MANTKITSQHINKIIGNLAISGGGGGLVAGKGIGASGSNINWNNNIFAELNETPQELVRKYEIYESTEDLLALSCAWHRIRKANKGSKNINVNISKLLDRQLFSLVNDDDKNLASAIRDYYSKKIMLWKLKNIVLTSYREDLNQFIHSDGLKFKESIFGLAYRLPQFYFYDLKLDEIFRERNRITKEQPIHRVKTLTFIDSTEVDRKTLKRNEYWFSDENNNVVAIYLVPNNPLLKVWEQLIKNPINLQGFYFNKRKDDFEFYQLEKFELDM